MGSYKKIGLSHEMGLIDIPPLLMNSENVYKYINAFLNRNLAHVPIIPINVLLTPKNFCLNIVLHCIKNCRMNIVVTRLYTIKLLYTTRCLPLKGEYKHIYIVTIYMLHNCIYKIYNVIPLPCTQAPLLLNQALNQVCICGAGLFHPSP